MKTLDEKIKTLKKFFNFNETFIVRQFNAFKTKMALCYFEEFVKFPEVSHAILEPLVSAQGSVRPKNFNKYTSCNCGTCTDRNILSFSC